MNDISKTIIGYSTLFNQIFNGLINKKISNSLIFFGDKGIGKKTFSLCLLNKYYSHFDSNSNTSNLIYNNSHPNILNISTEYDQKTKKMKSDISIDQIRNALPFIKNSSLNNRSKFLIIDTTDDLNISSSNSLLKILEEPNSDTYNILLVNQISQLLPTIRSRCIKFFFPNPSFENFNNIITNNNNQINDENIKFLYDLSNHSPGLALNLFNDDINLILKNLFDIFKEKKSLSNKIDSLSNEVSKYSNNEYKIFLYIIKFILHNSIKLNKGININNFYNIKTLNALKEVSNYIDNKISFKIIKFINEHEKKIYRLNLDKKFFNLNIFSILESK